VNRRGCGKNQTGITFLARLTGTSLQTGTTDLHIIVVNLRIVVQDHTNRVFGVAITVYRRKRDPWRLAGSSIVKTAGNGPGEAILETYLRVGKVQGLSTELLTERLAHARASCKGLQQGIGR
jgi:hypothetical protein